jgi:hypothetical protein
MLAPRSKAYSTLIAHVIDPEATKIKGRMYNFMRAGFLKVENMVVEVTYACEILRIGSLESRICEFAALG